MASIPLPRRRVHYRSPFWRTLLIGLIDGFTVVLRKANEGYSEYEFEQTRKDFFDEYTPAERRAMAEADRLHKEYEEECAQLWHPG